MLFQILSHGSVCESLFHSSEILLIYLNDLCCFRVLCYILVLQCGNFLKNCCVFLWGVTPDHGTQRAKGTNAPSLGGRCPRA